MHASVEIPSETVVIVTGSSVPLGGGVAPDVGLVSVAGDGVAAVVVTCVVGGIVGGAVLG